MTHKLLREAIDLIRDGGGTNIDTRAGGRHLFVGFDNPLGQRQEMTLHLGNKVKTHREHALRSQLRRCGLRIA